MKEGSFEGQIDGLDFSEEWTIKGTPLPTEIPKKMDLSALPAHVLRSNAVEALVSQNEDLMSRLGVALRRNSQLEEKISSIRLEGEQFRSKYENLNDQLLILKEKSRALTNRKDREESEYVSLKEKIRLLEVRYAELYSASEVKESHLLQQLERQTKTLRRFEKYRDHVGRAVENLKAAARGKRQAEVSLAQSEAAQENLRRNLAESADYITRLNNEHKQSIQALADQNEAKLAQMRQELAEAHGQNERLGEKLIDHENLIEEKLRLENDLIMRDRREDELRIQTATEIADLQKALSRYRNDAKDLALRLEQSTQELEVTATSLKETQSLKQNLEEQVENLQILWRDNQAQIEKLNEKNSSLQRLNQELSVALNQYRREIRTLKEKVDTKELKNIESPQQSSPEILQKIDKAIIEIYSPSSSRG